MSCGGWSGRTAFEVQARSSTPLGISSMIAGAWKGLKGADRPLQASHGTWSSVSDLGRAMVDLVFRWGRIEWNRPERFGHRFTLYVGRGRRERLLPTWTGKPASRDGSTRSLGLVAEVSLADRATRSDARPRPKTARPQEND